MHSRLLFLFISFAAIAYGQNELHDEVLSKLAYLVENPAHGYPSEEWAKTHVSLRDDPREIKPVLLSAVENEPAAYGAYALLLLQKRNEISSDTVLAAMSYSDRLYAKLSEDMSPEEQNQLMSNISFGFSAIESGSIDKFPETYFHKYALSGNDRLAAGSFELLSKYGTEQSIPILKKSLALIDRDSLRETLEKKYLQPLIAKYPSAPKEAEIAAVEIPPTPSTDKVAEEVMQSELVSEEPIKVLTHEPSAETGEKSSNWWLWLMCVAAIISGIGLVFRRRGLAK